MMKIMYTKLQKYSLYCKVVYVENTFCYKDYVYQVSKLQHIYVIDLKWIFFQI